MSSIKGLAERIVNDFSTANIRMYCDLVANKLEQQDRLIEAMQGQINELEGIVAQQQFHLESLRFVK